jgi:hypothetical protein
MKEKITENMQARPSNRKRRSVCEREKEIVHITSVVYQQPLHTCATTMVVPTTNLPLAEVARSVKSPKTLSGHCGRPARKKSGHARRTGSVPPAQHQQIGAMKNALFEQAHIALRIALTEGKWICREYERNIHGDSNSFLLESLIVCTCRIGMPRASSRLLVYASTPHVNPRNALKPPFALLILRLLPVLLELPLSLLLLLPCVLAFATVFQGANFCFSLNQGSLQVRMRSTSPGSSRSLGNKYATDARACMV